MKTLRVRIDDVVDKRLQEYCDSKDVSISDVVRAGILFIIEDHVPVSSPTVEKTKAPEVVFMEGSSEDPSIKVVGSKDPRADIRFTEDAYAKVMVNHKRGY